MKSFGEEENKMDNNKKTLEILEELFDQVQFTFPGVLTSRGERLHPELNKILKDAQTILAQEKKTKC